MNIKTAKEQITNAIKAYLQKDEFGEYIIPVEKQRPVFLLGAPGIGKTAIMEQISKELGILIVSYSMTHHTRQSAIGLPFIAKKSYAGREYNISEYTMSEIIAKVYEKMEETGIGEGILFLDEINCISETLAPAMLQFLQYKIFGGNQVPSGWVVITAGNPPEYNNSVKEFDVATLDRLKKIEINPEYDVWKEYAYENQIHNAIITYLDIKKDNFYLVETTVDGKNIITPRGWEDLSQMLLIYEDLELKIDQDLIIQYLQNKKVAKEFATYYDLYNKYKSDYQIDKILLGTNDEALLKRAREAKFDEKLSLISLLLEKSNYYMKNDLILEAYLSGLLNVLKEVKNDFNEENSKASRVLDFHIKEQKQILDNYNKSGTLTNQNKYVLNKIIETLVDYKKEIIENKLENNKRAFEYIKEDFDTATEAFKNDISKTINKLNNMFIFAEKAFGEENEILIMVTELTLNKNSASFISKFGCDKYYEHNKELLFYERQNQLLSQIEELILE